MTGSGVAVRTVVHASPDQVYSLVSDPVRMSELAGELERAGWLGGVREATVGARFRGHNRRAWRRWSTTATVTDAEPGRRFAFEVSSFAGIPVSRWQYDIEPAEDGCVVEERTWDRRPGWFKPFANLVTGVRDRAEENRRNIERTLSRLKSAVEAARG
jgi:hypothetical protein